MKRSVYIVLDSNGWPYPCLPFADMPSVVQKVRDINRERPVAKKVMWVRAEYDPKRGMTW